MHAGASEAWILIGESIEWLRKHYADYRFYTERDIVWTVQRRLAETAEPSGFRVFNDFGTEPGQYRSYSADIAICGDSGVLVAVEFKYEPSSSRTDIDKRKFPVTAWQGVVGDVSRIQKWTAAGLAAAGLALLIDERPSYVARFEAGHHWPLSPVVGGTWEYWGSYNRSDMDVSVHRFEIPPI